MKILILGATGRTGRHILQEAINEGYEINCLVRDPDKLNLLKENIQVFEGTPTNPEVLEKSLIGCDAVINALNVSRKSDFPWAKLRAPETLLSDTMKNLLTLSKKGSFKRVIICSAWGVSETKTDLPGWFRWFIDNSNIGAAYQDHERQEELLMNSNLDWTIVRPSGLINTKKEQQVIESYSNQPKPKLTISRLSVARYMVKALKNETLIKKAPTLSA